MTGPPPAVARLRVAVRRVLGDLPGSPSAARPLVLVACSGGADSMALAAATAFVAPREGFRAGLVTVDHGLQDGSAEHAAAVADWARNAGLAPVEIATVTVDPAGGGPEAAAREARYTALTEAADRLEAAAILLGHTRDDQAETVLLALARGSGPRGLAAMPATRGRYRRPLLDLPRTDTVETCRALDLPVWTDPHNTDPAYTRSRLRAAMPVLVETFGDRVVANLARTATLVAADNDALDDYALTLLRTASEPPDADDPDPESHDSVVNGEGSSVVGADAVREPDRASLRPRVVGSGMDGRAPSDGSKRVEDSSVVGADAIRDSGGANLRSRGTGSGVDGRAPADGGNRMADGNCAGRNVDGTPEGGPAASSLTVATLAAAHSAVRSRALRAWALAAGADADGLAYVHIEAMNTLVIRWRGQGPVFLPGRLIVTRDRTRLSIRHLGG